MNIQRDAVLISQSEQQSLFTSNQEDADTRITLNFWERCQPVSLKTKYKDNLISMVYTFDVTSPPYDWYLQIDYEKVFQNLGKTRDTDLSMFTSVFIPLLAATLSATSSKYHSFSTIADGWICSTSH